MIALITNMTITIDKKTVGTQYRWKLGVFFAFFTTALRDSCFKQTENVCV